MKNHDPERDGHVQTCYPIVHEEAVKDNKKLLSLYTLRKHCKGSSGLFQQLEEKGAASAHKVKLIYINGMQTTPRHHRQTAEILATAARRSVVGVYNLTGIAGHSTGKRKHFGSDLVQSARDYVTPVGRGPRFGPTHDNLTQLRNELRDNIAALELFNMVIRGFLKYGGTRKTVIVAHSQGNLITANVAWCLLRAYAPNPLPGRLKVIGVASPNPSWPTNGERNFKWRTFNDRRDPVTYAAFLPEMVAAALIGVAVAGPGGALAAAVAAYFKSTNSNGSRDIENIHKGVLPSLDAHDVENYIFADNFIRELTRSLT